MRKSFLTVISLAVLLLACGYSVRSQQPRVAEREAQWNRYVLPDSTFVRYVDSSKAVLLRVPGAWEQRFGQLEFSGPNNASLKVMVQKIPDGSPLQGYVSGIMQPLRGVSDGPDSIIVRATTMSGLDAREIVFESDEGSAELTRRIIWCSVQGATAVSLVLIAPLNRVAEIEPYFKAVVQSVTFINEYDYERFYQQRSSAIKEAKPQRVDEVQSLATSLSSSIGGGTRQASIAKLASILASEPDTAIDLILDRRPMVRAAVCEAIVQSRNSALEPFLWRALDDSELFVAEHAARSIAANSKVIDALRNHAFDWFRVESLVRVWPFLNRSNQSKILEEIFAQPLVPAPPASKPAKPATTPPKGEPSGKRPGVTVRATILRPGDPPPAIATTSDPNRYLTGLTLLRDLPVSEFKLPLNSILAAKNDSLTTLALQVAWERNELLPVAQLLNLLSSPNKMLRKAAALSLGQSAGVADINTIEGYATKRSESSDPAKESDEKDTLAKDLQLTIAKIRLREQLATASGEARQELIQKNLANPELAEWLWDRYVRENTERSEPKSHSSRQAKVLPLGENLFPKDVTHYAALPQPATALDKLSGAIEGLQLNSARSQASFVLILNLVREQLAEEFDSPRDVRPLGYSGIDLNQPIALAKWFAEGAPKGIPSAQREALILRVTDRARFERLLERYQHIFGNFGELSEVVAGGVRFLPIVPAFLPISAKALLEGAIEPPQTRKKRPMLTYTFVGALDWNGHSIKLVEQRNVDEDGIFDSDRAYLTYLSDTAVLAPDLESLREVLNRAAGERPGLALNAEFKRAVETQGEVIYLSDLGQVMAAMDAVATFNKDRVTESGALRISNSLLENFYEIRFDHGAWLKAFRHFQPQELLSPKELLPRTTVAYYFMNFDTAVAWRDWSSHLFNAEERKGLTSLWAIDFEKEILPELGPECGVAVLGLPNPFHESWQLPWVVFFKLKTDKITRASDAGKFLTDGVAGTGPVQIKSKGGDLFVVARNGFLVFSGSREAINALDHKEKLISSRDFSRAAQRAPGDLVAFGGYNLEAAIASIDDSGNDVLKTVQSSLMSSLANAFHSPNFYATATSNAVQGRLSLSMDREGRFSVSELASLSKDYGLSYAELEARGLPIQNQERLSSLKIRVRARGAGEIDRLKEDVSSSTQTAEKVAEGILDLTILPRNSAPKTSLLLPVKDPKLDPYLKPSHEIRSDNTAVINKAREIVGEERDAWSVARKLAEWTYKNITWKRVDYATAPQTLATREADCLEFSQLYVAMARSLGLPARIVFGLAHSGGTFAGHAWVEVYVGSWIEVDPTWGTDFVDATHMRDSTSGTLLTYASLNLIELEILEATAGLAEFQKDVQALAEKLCQELPIGTPTALTSALDLRILASETPALGAWDSLSDSEREVLSSAYRRILLSINAEVSKATLGAALRLLKVKENGETAEALVIQPVFGEVLLKIRFIKRNSVWFLSEILHTDTGLHIIAEILQPAISTILDRRRNKSAPGHTSDFFRILAVMQKDAKAALNIVERVLQKDSQNQGLRHLKALVLDRDNKTAEAIQLWKELASAEKPYAPALVHLAARHEFKEDQAEKKLAIEFYTRYGELEPDDSRTHVALARLYDEAKDDARAEAAHRAALRLDPSNTSQFVEFATFLAMRKRFNEVASIIAEAEKKARPDDDLFGDVMAELHFTEDEFLPEELARRLPQKMEKSAKANLYLAYTRLEKGKNLQAIPLLSKAVALKVDWHEPYVAMARGYRALRNWKVALKAAETALRIEPEDSDAHFQRACALARLGQITGALKSLERSVELDPDQLELIEEEADLKVLASRPAFKKLLADKNPEQ